MGLGVTRQGHGNAGLSIGAESGIQGRTLGVIGVWVRLEEVLSGAYLSRDPGTEPI